MKTYISIRRSLHVAGCALLAAVALGCNTVKQHLVTITRPDGTVEQTTDCTARSFWDSKESIAKLRASNGKTQTVGVSGLEQESSGSNAVALLKTGIETLVDTAWKAGKASVGQ